MIALLWKEARENAYKVATALGVVLLVHLLRRFGDFNRGFCEDVGTWAVAVGGLCAGVLAMDAIAGERSRGTLEFLLVRPTTVPRILAAKFAVGAAGLFAVIAAFWAMVYATPMTGVALWEGYTLQTIADVGWLQMVYAWYLPLLVAYAIVFMASAATQNPAEAAGAGAIVALTASAALLLFDYFFPAAKHSWPWVEDLVAVGLVRGGELVRTAMRGPIVLGRTLLAGALAAAAFAAAVVIAGRYREFTLGRRALVISGFGLGALLLAVPRLLPDGIERVLPTAAVRVGDGARSLAVDGEVAYVLRRDSLLAVDLADREHPRLAAAAGHLEGWSMSSLVLLDGYACARARKSATPTDSTGVLCFDVGDPRQPRAAGAWVAAAPWSRDDDEGPFYGEPRPLTLERVGDVLLAGAVGTTQSTLTSLTVSAAGDPEVADSLVLETYDYPEEQWQDEFRYRRGFFLQQHRFEIEPATGHAYLGMHTGLLVIQVGPRGRLAERAWLDLADHAEHMRGSARSVVVRGDTAWVERNWPAETVAVDVSDPAHPRAVGVYRPGTHLADRFDAGFFWALGQGVRLYDPADPYRRPTPMLSLPREDRFWGSGRPVLRDGWGYAVMDDELALFRLPARRGER